MSKTRILVKDKRLRLRFTARGDKLFFLMATFVSSSVIGLSVLIAITLVHGSSPVLERFGLEFLIGMEWNPVAGREDFGILPYILGTLVTSAIALAIGFPLSLGIAIFISELAPAKTKLPLSFLIELLAAVPSVIYGLWGLFVLRPWIRDYIEVPLASSLGFIPAFKGTPFGLDILTAGVILSIMIVPTVSSVSREVLAAVPLELKEAAYSLGATRWEAIRLAVLSYARSGLFGAAILGLGRAVGETMAVTMVIGNAIGPAAMPLSLFQAGQTMASIIAQEFNEADPASLHPSALVGIGLVLFFVALVINIVARLLVGRIAAQKGGQLA